VGRAISTYVEWGSGELLDKVVVAYSTMWGSTDVLARTIADALIAQGLEVHLYDLAVTSYAQLMVELQDARGLLIGSPTLHHGMLFRVAGFLQYVGGLVPAGRLAAAFGSYGWSSGATKQVTDRLAEIGFEVAQDSYTQKFRPTEAELVAASEWAVAFADKVKATGA
jgi:flavorubredoxin